MARARLHLICGNCGCNSMWSYAIHPEGHDIEGELFPAVFLSCGNCSTMHDLSNTAREEKIVPYNEEEAKEDLEFLEKYRNKSSEKD
jgi:hypothetical protein